MTLLPIVGRELLVQARQDSTYWVRVAISSIALVVMLWVFAVSGGSISIGSQGKQLFLALAIFSFVYCFFVGGALTADCVSFEKREGTLGLLFLTDLKGRDVVLGKIASSSLHAAYGTLGLVPMMGNRRAIVLRWRERFACPMGSEASSDKAILEKTGRCL